MVVNEERVGSINLNDPIIIQDESGNVISSGLRSTTRLNPQGIGLLNDRLEANSLTGILMNAVGFAYSNLDSVRSVTWENITNKIEAIQAITQASNSTTLNINNSIQVQNGETVSNPTQYVTISSDASGNRISLDGDYGTAGQILSSGGDNGYIYWGTGGGGSVGTLGDVMTNGNIASKNLDMSGFTIENAVIQLTELNVATDPTTLPLLESAGTVIPITLNGTTYYLQLFNSPP
jgi:hypothetical protein